MLIETIDYKGHSIEIFQDQDPIDPREYDHLGEMVFFHRNYDLGDKHNYSMEELKEMIETGEYIYLPVYIYEHLGITINTTGFSCRWDSRQLGYIIISKEKAKKEYGWKILTKGRIREIEQSLENEVTEYDQYLTGDVYGYGTDCGGGCWGYYGETGRNYMIEEAKAEIDFVVKEEKQEELKEFNFVMTTI